MKWRVPLVDVALSDDDVEAYLDRLRSGWLTMGPFIEEFENELVAFTGAEHACCVSSGTAGLHLAMLAAGVGPGDEVIVPALTFVASANAVRYVGAEPVFCDSVGLLQTELDVADVERRITSNTKAVVAVHFMGNAAPLDELRVVCDRHDLVLIEDASQSMGAEVENPRRQVGTIGDIGVISFNAKAQLPVGEGGVVLCRTLETHDRVRSLRSHGMTTVTWDRHRGHHAGYDIVEIGFNYRLDEPRAALGMSRLARLASDIERRRDVARAYRHALQQRPAIGMLGSAEGDDRSSPYGFAIVVDDEASRDDVRTRLAAEGIETARYPLLTALSAFGGSSRELPNVESFAARHLVLPVHAHMTEATVAFVSESLLNAL
jgi:dTDP-4-amino-4,6-dideoxygalactose transaminase